MNKTTTHRFTKGLHLFVIVTLLALFTLSQGDTVTSDTEVAFVDASVQEAETLIRALPSHIEVHRLDHSGSGLAQIAEILSGRRNVDTVHIFSDGAPGWITLGADTLTTDDLKARTRELAHIGKALSERGDILLYGCDIGQDSQFVQQMSELTGADVAASEDPTGFAELGGDWKLEVSAGQVAAKSLGGLESSYHHLLTAPTNIHFGAPLPFTVEAGNSYVAPLGSLVPGAQTDDSSVEVTINDTIEDGLQFGATTYNTIWVGSNGYLTFGHSQTSFSAVGIPGYTNGPMIAAQFDDIDPSKGGDVYIYEDDANDRVTVTWYQVAPYRTPTGAGSGVNTFQIRLHGLGGGDFGIEIRYDAINWIQSGNVSSWPTAGWTIGDAVTYGEVTDSGTADFITVEDESNIEHPGVFAWAVWNGKIDERTPENSPGGTVVFPLTADDDGPLSELTFTLLDDDGGNFEIFLDGGVYKVRVAAGATLDYETSPGHIRQIHVQATDQELPPSSGSAWLDIPLTDVNEAPTDIGLDSTDVDENQPVNTVVGNLSTTDQDTGDSHTYSLENTGGCAGLGPDNDSFNVNVAQLRTSEVFDYEATGTYTVCVRTDDGHSGTYNEQFVITVNDAPAADAGDDQTVGVGNTVTLDGSASSDANGDALTYGWTQTGGTTVSFTPTLSRTTFTAPSAEGVLTFTLTVTDSLGLPDPTSDEVVVTVVEYYVYLPLIFKSYVVAPDLVVQSIVATNHAITVTIQNTGNGPTNAGDEFWIDVYIDPHPAPTAVNQIWPQLADEGLVWGVTTVMQPGDVITLTVGDAYYVTDRSKVTWPLLEGATIYAQVDSWDGDTTYGAVLESHEIIGGTYNNISSTTATAGTPGAALPATQSPSIPSGDLPPR